jgi:hypothetical protein
MTFRSFVHSCLAQLIMTAGNTYIFAIQNVTRCCALRFDAPF